VPERGDVWQVDLGAFCAASAILPRNRCDSSSKRLFAGRGSRSVSEGGEAQTFPGNPIKPSECCLASLRTASAPQAT
jgi:hypothetical protein